MGGEDREDRGVGGRDSVEEVDSGVPHGMVAVNVEELAVGAVEAVQWNGISSGS